MHGFAEYEPLPHLIVVDALREPVMVRAGGPSTA